MADSKTELSSLRNNNSNEDFFELVVGITNVTSYDYQDYIW